ncbi:hypothetical protein [Phyllobacterium zundukense]|uniref:Uncharacterized protein n=1 Tax=Phyllobacterium zundukense TaxID=1867719 RepID=A0ACD4CX52_9HYPH|nr:hypothetical protein [Phyllobacterium zundukense]UXN58151.1 hypothetical protein N8E88_04825 [Phyllobacterium zundukense]
MAFAIYYIALLASEPQSLERPTMTINFDQIAGNEENSLLTFATYLPVPRLGPRPNLTASKSIKRPGPSLLFYMTSAVYPVSQSVRNVRQAIAGNGLCR